jgi:hypothetical protein
LRPLGADAENLKLIVLKFTVPNGRALEVLPHQLQLKQTGPGETWLAFLVDDKGYNPESKSFVPLVRFPVSLKRPKERSSPPRRFQPTKL